MYDHIKRYQSVLLVLPLFEYRSQETLLSDLQQKVTAPAEQKAKELTVSVRRIQMITRRRLVAILLRTSGSSFMFVRRL